MKLVPTFLRGSYTPVVTPFRAGKVDYEKFVDLIEGQIQGGSHGVVVAGTTGESTSLTAREREELFKTAARVSKGRIPIVAGTGCGSCQNHIRALLKTEALSTAPVLPLATREKVSVDDM